MSLDSVAVTGSTQEMSARSRGREAKWGESREREGGERGSGGRESGGRERGKRGDGSVWLRREFALGAVWRAPLAVGER